MPETLTGEINRSPLSVPNNGPGAESCRRHTPASLSCRPLCMASVAAAAPGSLGHDASRKI